VLLALALQPLSNHRKDFNETMTTTQGKAKGGKDRRFAAHLSPPAAKHIPLV